MTPTITDEHRARAETLISDMEKYLAIYARLGITECGGLGPETAQLVLDAVKPLTAALAQIEQDTARRCAEIIQELDSLSAGTIRAAFNIKD